MMRFEPPTEPAEFGECVRVPGQTWLQGHPDATAKSFPPNWDLYLTDLAHGFCCLCAYSAVITTDGVVDHYLSKSQYRELAYEWSNYRYASSRMNSRKWTHDEKILDPFEVQDDWFEVQLGTWQLLITDNIPRGQRDRARFTLNQLRLDTGDDAVRVRRDYYDDFITGDFTLTALTRVAPLVARAVKRVLEPLQPPLDEAQHYCQFLVGEISVIKLEKDAPIIAGVVRSRLPGCSRRFPV